MLRSFRSTNLNLGIIKCRSGRGAYVRRFTSRLIEVSLLNQSKRWWSRGLLLALLISLWLVRLGSGDWASYQRPLNRLVWLGNRLELMELLVNPIVLTGEGKRDKKDLGSKGLLEIRGWIWNLSGALGGEGVTEGLAVLPDSLLQLTKEISEWERSLREKKSKRYPTGR